MDTTPKFNPRLGRDETGASWGARFYGLARQSKRLLRKEDDSLWLVGPGHPPERLNTLDEFMAKVWMVCSFVYTDDKGLETPKPPDRDDCRLLFYSPQKALLPVLTNVIHEPAIFRAGNRWKLTPPGFDEVTGIYYWIPPMTRPIEPLEGQDHLKMCFSGVPFERPEYRNNLLAWLLGAVVLSEEIEAPLMVVSGNQRGIGKSKTVESAGIILTGQSQSPVDQHGAEFEKQLGTRFREGSRFIALDNVTTGDEKNSYQNDRLARLLTQGYSKKVRVLGHSRSVEQRGVLFALSANDCKLDADLASRALPVKLFAEDSNLMTPYVLDYAKEHRRELYGELLSLALFEPGPHDEGLFPAFRFRAWFNFVYPRIHMAFGPMAVLEAQEFDDAVMELFAWGNDQAEGFVFDAKFFQNELNSGAARFSGLCERFKAITSTRAKSTAISKFLMKNVDRVDSSIPKVIQILRVHSPSTHNAPASFRFERQANA